VAKFTTTLATDEPRDVGVGLADVGDSRQKCAMGAKYDIIGNNYAELRKPDQRIACIIESALGSAQVVLNVGAGTGSYEPTGRCLIAVEPSREMIRKRSPAAAKAIQASADNLPFDDESFEASMAILTIHHWPDKEAGLREMRRVTRGRIVLLTFDPAYRPWLTDYLPELAALDEAQMPRMSDYERWLALCRSHRFWCHTIAAMDSSMPTGVGLLPILTRTSDPAVRPSGPSAMPKRDCKISDGTLKPASGSAATPNC
jgi:SAM-dependent methyltransferase